MAPKMTQNAEVELSTPYRGSPKFEINTPVPDHEENEEPTGCSKEGVITFVVGLVAGTFSAIICKVEEHDDVNCYCEFILRLF